MAIFWNQLLPFLASIGSIFGNFWTVQNLPKLACNIPRQRVQNTLCLPTQPGHTASRASVSSRADSSSEGGDSVSTGEGSRSPCDRQPKGLLFKLVIGTQEEWPNEASDQPEAVEQVGDHRTLQDGGNPNPEGYPQIRGLVHEGGPERCLLHSPHRSRPPAVSEIHVGRGELPVYMPPVWPILCPPHIYKGTDASDGSTPVMGVRIIVYIDDMLILAETLEQASQHFGALVWILQALGFIVN